MTWIHPGACQRTLIFARSSMVNDPSENDIGTTPGDTMYTFIEQVAS